MRRQASMLSIRSTKTGKCARMHVVAQARRPECAKMVPGAAFAAPQKRTLSQSHPETQDQFMKTT